MTTPGVDKTPALSSVEPELLIAVPLVPSQRTSALSVDKAGPVIVPEPPAGPGIHVEVVVSQIYASPSAGAVAETALFCILDTVGAVAVPERSPPISTLSVFKLTKLASTSLLVNGDPFPALVTMVVKIYPYSLFIKKL